MGYNGLLCVLMCSYVFLCVFMSFYEFLLVFNGALWVFIGFYYMLLWVCVVSYSTSRIRIGFLFVFMGSYEFLSIPNGFYAF